MTTLEVFFLVYLCQQSGYLSPSPCKTPALPRVGALCAAFVQFFFYHLKRKV